jgi:hypothetical protein
MKDLCLKLLLTVFVSLFCPCGDGLALAQQSNNTPPTPILADPKKCVAAVDATSHTLTRANELRGSANASALRITGLVESQDSVASVLRDVTGAVRELDLHGMPKALGEAQDDLNADSKSISQACAFASGETSTAIDDAKAKADVQTKNISDSLSGLKGAQNALSDALTKAIGFAIAGAAAQKDKITALDKMADGAADTDTVENTLAKGLPVFADTVAQRKEFGEQWDKLWKLTAVKDLRKPDSGDSPAPDPVAPKLHELDGSIEKIESKLPEWAGALSSKAQTERDSLAGLITDVLKDPSGNGGAALAKQKDSTADLPALEKVLRAWPKLHNTLDDQSYGHLAALSKSVEDLNSSVHSLRLMSVRLTDALNGDMENFETQSVRLYYFTDVRRLMYALNPGFQEVGGLSDAKEAAARQRKALTETELALADAQAEVNRLLKSVENLQEEQRHQNAAVSSKDLLQNKFLNKLKKDQRGEAVRLSDLNATKSGSGAASDPKAQAKIDRLQKDYDAATLKTQQSQSDYTQAQTDYNQANDKLEASKTEKDGIPAKLADARNALEAAQADVAKERRKMVQAAEAESEAFAFARDNAPFFVADGLAVLNDPVKRATIYGFADSATIVIRGQRDDVDKVRALIQEFDAPAPQARLTLWTFNISKVVGQKGNPGEDRINRSLEIIDEELGNTRALVDTTLTLLREKIAEQVHLQESGHQVCPSPHPINVSAVTNAWWRPKVQRLGFFAPAVLDAFQLDWQHPTAERVYQMPDPAVTTTLGESLLMLSLSCQSERSQILQNFRNELGQSIRTLQLRLRDNNGLARIAEPADFELNSQVLADSFPLTAQALAARVPAPTGDGLTSAQYEIVHAITSAWDRGVLDEIRTKLGQIRIALNDVHKEKAAPGINKVRAEELAADENNLVLQSQPLFAYLRKRYGVQPAEVNLKTIDSLFSKLLDSQSQARVAAADQMLKEFNIAVEDDLNNLFIQPMIHRLRSRLARTSVNVGILQRESMLATNRLVARVDPRATAQLQIGDEQNILDSIQQLGQLYMAVQSGGALGALGALQQQKHEAPPEIYGVGTGNTFQVTPIFDPSGQALRFKLDYVSQTRITEPTGGTNPQLPRIERHTVNTEVQLSNMETREISRFEANSKIGIPTRYWGGVPVLKDIPYVRPYVPLIGWFVRKAGKDAAAQQSVIFGQATMYPTIGDLVNLLLQSKVRYVSEEVSQTKCSCETTLPSNK